MTTAPAPRDRSTPDRPALALLGLGASSPLEAAFEALPFGVLVCAPGGDRANAELRRMLGIRGRRAPDRALLQRRLQASDASTGAGSSPRLRLVDAALAGEAAPPRLLNLRRMNGTTAVVRVTALPLAVAGGPGAVVTVVDETAAHEVERLRDAFLGIVGHELRSPISSILAAAELLRDDGLPADVRAELARDLGEEAGRLHQLVEQLIRLADLRRLGDVLDDEPTHLPHLVRSQIVRWRSRQPRLDLRLEVPRDGPPAVAGHAGYVGQVLDILVDNAVKYAGVKAPLVIRLEASHDEVCVHVLDEGPGLPGSDGEPLFELFRRALPRGTADGRVGARGDAIAPVAPPAGQGIGLFVARSIVEALGGRIWATNRAEGGADVGFALPVATD